MKKYLKAFEYILISFLIFTFLLTLLNYFDVISNNILKILKVIISIATILIGGIYIGFHSEERGYLSGLKLGGLFVLLILAFSFLGLDKNINVSRIIYYLIVVITSMLGSMIGINKKNKVS